MFLRRFIDVTEKTSFLRYARDVLKTSRKRHLFLRCFGDDVTKKDLSKTSHASWATNNGNAMFEKK